MLASVLGILFALPVGLLGARNMMPAWVSWPARSLVALCRALHPVIVAILFVKAVGFGALAGILALTVASIGFIGKLFTEAIEEISLKQVEAVRASGASFANVIIFGVLPQVFARFIGFATYQFDSNLRNSTMVGIVGAGGVGGTLFSAFQRFDYDFVSAILLTLIAIIMLGEIIAGFVRAVFLDNLGFDRILQGRFAGARGIGTGKPPVAARRRWKNERPRLKPESARLAACVAALQHGPAAAALCAVPAGGGSHRAGHTRRGGHTGIPV